MNKSVKKVIKMGNPILRMVCEEVEPSQIKSP